MYTGEYIQVLCLISHIEIGEERAIKRKCLPQPSAVVITQRITG